MKIFKSLISTFAIIGLLVLTTGCPKVANGEKTSSPQGMVNFTFFNTVSYVYSYAGDSQEAFDTNGNAVFGLLQEYHRLFDIYYEHSGINNLRTINLSAGGDAVEVDQKLIDFLLYAEELYEITDGEMNIMMGAVLSLWHDAREAKTIEGLYCSYCRKFSSAEECVDNKCPQQDPDSPSDSNAKCQHPVVTFEYELEQRAKHISFDSLEIDAQNCTVRITDPEASIDVGALGKGYATEKAAQYLQAQGVTGYALNIGGNLRLIGTKDDGTEWRTGIKDPANPEQYATILSLSDTSCVTSGDYERFFMVGREKYHHIIDKDTLMPATYFRSISIITQNSGLADALSTALFCMSYEDGLELISRFDDVEVIWILRDGEMRMTEGVKDLISEQ